MLGGQRALHARVPCASQIQSFFGFPAAAVVYGVGVAFANRISPFVETFTQACANSMNCIQKVLLTLLCPLCVHSRLR
jgi:hypothetical protein